MQDPVRRQVVLGLAGLAGLAATVGAGTTAALAQAPSGARAATIRIRADIAPGTHKSVRLNNVPAGARLAFAVEASNRITLSLLTDADAQRYPAVTEALFTAAVEQTLTFSASVPAAGTYILVLDNAKGETVSQVRVAFRATRGPVKPPPSSSTPEAPSTDAPPRLRRRPDMHEM